MSGPMVVEGSMPPIVVGVEEAVELSATPPEMLQAMRLINADGPVEPRWGWLINLRAENPRAFMKDLLAAEREWRECVAKLERPAAAQGEDGGSERVLEMIEGVLSGKVQVGEE